MKFITLMLALPLLYPILPQGAPAKAWSEYEAGRKNLPDYSWAGYEYFEKPLPTFTRENAKEFPVEAYGAVADDGKGDREAVQKAIQGAEAFTAAHPDRWAIVRFGRGRYDLRTVADLKDGAIRIQGDRVVLSGAGRGDGGTDLFAEAASPHPVLLIQPEEKNPEANFRGKPLARLEVPDRVDDYNLFEPVDSVTVKAGDEGALAAYRPGDILTVAGSWQKHEAEYFQPLAPFGKKRFYIVEPHEIKAVDGRKVTFREPIWHKASDLSDLFVSPVVRRVGVENLSLTGNFREKMRHYYSSQSDGYELVGAKNLRNGFFRNLRFRHGTCAVNLTRSSACTVWDAAFTEHWGHMMVRAVGGSYGNFFGLLREEAPSWHGIGTSDYTWNTVIWRSSQRGSYESHGNSTYACLVDRNSGDLALDRVGGAAPFNHRGLTFWNWQQVPYGGVFEKDPVARFDVHVRPALVGVYGDMGSLKIQGNGDQLSLDEGFGTEVSPPSLFEAQLEKRLGKIPAWVTAEAAAFEKGRRFARGDLVSPLSMYRVGAGESIRGTFAPDPQFPAAEVAKVEFLVGDRPTPDRGPEKILATITTAPFSAALPGLAPGHWYVRARMTTRTGDEFTTAQHMVRVGAPGETRSVPADAWWWQDADAALSPILKAVAEGESNAAPFLEKIPSLLSLGKARSDALPLVDESGEASLSVNTMHRYNFQCDTRHMIHLDLGRSETLSRVELAVRFSRPDSGVELELAVSEDPRAPADVRNRFDVWKVIARETFTGEEIKRFAKGDGHLIPLYLPRERARFVRLLVAGWIPEIGSLPNTTTLRKISCHRVATP